MNYERNLRSCAPPPPMRRGPWDDTRDVLAAWIEFALGQLEEEMLPDLLDATTDVLGRERERRVRE